VRDPSSLLAILVAATGISVAASLTFGHPRHLCCAIALLVATIAGTVALGETQGLPQLPSNAAFQRAVAAGLIAYLAIWPGGTAIGLVLARMDLKPSAGLGTPGTGRLVGRLERLVMVIAVPAGGPAAVALRSNSPDSPPSHRLGKGRTKLAPPSTFWSEAS